jgi:hypothetical protein
MPTQTYTPLANITLGSAQTSVSFSSIPASYRDLIVVFRGTVNIAGDYYITFNGDTTNTNYSMVRMLGTGSAATSQAQSTREIGVAYATQGNIITQIMDYSATDKHTTSLSRSNYPDQNLLAYASRWANTAAVTSVGFSINGGYSFQTGATFALYGIAS